MRVLLSTSIFHVSHTIDLNHASVCISSVLLLTYKCEGSSWGGHACPTASAGRPYHSEVHVRHKSQHGGTGPRFSPIRLAGVRMGGRLSAWALEAGTRPGALAGSSGQYRGLFLRRMGFHITNPKSLCDGRDSFERGTPSDTERAASVPKRRDTITRRYYK